jgi:hypothetical protein
LNWLGKRRKAIDVRLYVTRGNVPVTRVNEVTQRHVKFRGVY